MKFISYVTVNKYQSFQSEMHTINFDHNNFMNRTNLENFPYIMTYKEIIVLKAVGKFLLNCNVS